MAIDGYQDHLKHRKHARYWCLNVQDWNRYKYKQFCENFVLYEKNSVITFIHAKGDKHGLQRQVCIPAFTL